MNTNNEEFNKLVKYIDYDLNDALTDIQKDTIYQFAADAAGIEDRTPTARQRAEDVLSAARMEKLPIKGEPIQEYGCKWWICNNKATVVAVVLIIAAAIGFI